MMERKYGAPFVEAVNRLEKASSRVGLSEDQVVDLLASGLQLEHLLEYVNAVLAQRVH